MSSYTKIIKFGSGVQSQSANPLTYCINDNLDNTFMHGSNLYGQHSNKCQMFLSDYCSLNWDENCEIASKNLNKSFPNTLSNCNGSGNCNSLNAGEILIRNTASKKYLSKDFNCSWNYEPFDPTVYNSPLVRYMSNKNCNGGYGNCIYTYEVNPNGLDNDPVMNKILEKPHIASDILLNIYNTMKKKGTLDSLKGTRLGTFYKLNKQYFQ